MPGSFDKPLVPRQATFPHSSLYFPNAANAALVVAHTVAEPDDDK
ncbi:MAG: hypothetical protein QGI63_08025 [Rhodospirillales bacterium]|nr:hypothetical protein [Rhodospirillales bacterium]